MNILIVHAHPEPKSFNGALTRRAVDTLAAEGHRVVVSDLYAMGFNPVSDRRNFKAQSNPEYYKQQVEEKLAHETDSFADDIRAEMDKLFACDALIFQFPLWWFSVPAILKGWVDRVFACHRVYGGGKWYNNGSFVGKRAMCSVTIGSASTLYEPTGLHGDIHDQVLFHINHGMLAFTGFTVVKPFLVHGPARMTPEQRDRELDRYAACVRSLWSLPTYAYEPLDKYDESFRLREAARPEQHQSRSG